VPGSAISLGHECHHVPSRVRLGHRNMFAAFPLCLRKQTFPDAPRTSAPLSKMGLIAGQVVNVATRFLRGDRKALPQRPCSADRTRSPARVSAKREYFKYLPETSSNFALRLRKSGDQRLNLNHEKPAIGGHICGLSQHSLWLSDCVAEARGFELTHS
jgi:hypothetical protein